MRAGVEHVETSPELSWALREFHRPAFEFSWHLHAELELTLITHGSGTRIVGDSIESYRQWDLALIGSEVPHAYVSTPGTEHHDAIVIQFGRDFLGPGFFARPEFIAVDRLLDAVGGALVFRPTVGIIERIRSLASLAPPERTLALVRLLVELAGADDARSIAAYRSIGRLSQPARRRVDTICAHLQATFASPVRLAEVASVAHMTPAALSRFFHRAVGRTITDYVTELRVAAACQLLSESDLPIAEVATRSGYDNLSNFNRRFRALKGMSPSRYRRAISGGASHPYADSRPA